MTTTTIVAPTTTKTTVSASTESTVTAAADFFPFGEQNGDSLLNIGTSGIVKPVSHFITRNGTFNSLEIGTNGIISIDQSYNSPSPRTLTQLPSNINVLCPYWMHVSFGNRSKVTYQLYDKDSFQTGHDVNINSTLYRADQLIRKYRPSKASLAIRWVLVATWYRVSPFTLRGTPEELSFQVVLMSNGRDTYVTYNYRDVNMTALSGREIVIGYKIGKTVLTNPHSERLSASTIDQYKGNQDNLGFYFYELSDPSSSTVTSAVKCLDWYQGNKNGMIANPYLNIGNFSTDTFCPCYSDMRSLDQRFNAQPYFRDGFLCTAAIIPSILPGTRECCYDVKTGAINKDQSRFLVSNPAQQSEYEQLDKTPRIHCCVESTGLCDLYRELRPTTKCRSKYTSSVGWVYGDPHFESLDGKKYTFNGYGEYVMIKVNTLSDSFELQARTELALSDNGNPVNATVFTAFAARDNANASMQVEMSADRNGMVIYGNGRDVTVSFNSDTNYYRIFDGTLSIQRNGDSAKFGFISSGIYNSVKIAVKTLSVSTTIPEKFMTQTTGLLGNYNGIQDDDFILPNGTILPNRNYTQQELFWNFGQLWETTSSTTLFDYHNVASWSDYSHPSFVPLFLDEFSSKVIRQAEIQCGLENPSCVFDLITTGDQILATETLNVDNEATKTRQTIENLPPTITGNTSIIATVGRTSYIYLAAADEDQVEPPTFRILSQPSSSFLLDSSTGIVSWTPNNTDIVSISVTVYDIHNASAVPLDVEIFLCSGCSGHGRCTNDFSSTDNTNFKILTCSCDTGYQGVNCGMEEDGCQNDPCSVKRQCTDLTPAQQVLLGRSYNCSPCPSGYVEQNDQCYDIDECVNSTLNTCDQICQNTEGAFTCDCYQGYRISNSKCQDIDECVEDTDSCEQVCNNIPGNYTCGCFYGYQLKPDGHTCNQTLDVCAINNLTCTYACTSQGGNFNCACQGGYKLGEDGQTCIDEDECLNNICQQTCSNTAGGYTCSCVDGYLLSDDKTTCDVCGDQKWGPRCVNTCNCGEGAITCDPAIGCVCSAGWEGTYCHQDINECIVDSSICGFEQLCVNNEGSYRCACPSGYTKSGRNCINIDECSLSLDNCSSTSTCEDNEGGFSCVCNSGYAQVDAWSCANVDECATGSHDCEQICLDVDGGYNCLCEFGYSLAQDRRRCLKVSDTCAAYRNLNCSYTCRIENGNNPVCICKSGYLLSADNQTCSDINECDDPSLNLCSPASGCTNTDGGYTCTCTVGYKLENDKRTCKACDSQHWGPGCSNKCNCGHIGTVRCDSILGCICKSGWTDTLCSQDIDECHLGNVCTGSNEQCQNLPGTYQCVCSTGYSNTSGTCQDINECETDNSCHQTCINTAGSYRCECREGFSGSIVCKDIDECKSGQHLCDQNCDNTLGNYRCSCNEGYLVNATDKRSCYAKTVCTNLNCSQSCAVNSTLHENCQCSTGYVLSIDGETCNNINECLNSPCSHNCTDLVPGYRCSCPSGYSLSQDKITCQECRAGTYGRDCLGTCSCIASNTLSCDKEFGTCNCRPGWNGTNCSLNINECTTNRSQCSSHAVCRDTPGSYICQCEDGYAFTNIEICAECPAGKYGASCSETCACEFANTEKCDKKNGTCYCLSGWEGARCSIKVDECLRNPLLCTTTSIATTSTETTPTSDFTVTTGLQDTSTTSATTSTETTPTSDFTVTTGLQDTSTTSATTSTETTPTSDFTVTTGLQDTTTTSATTSIENTPTSDFTVTTGLQDTTTTSATTTTQKQSTETEYHTTTTIPHTTTTVQETTTLPPTTSTRVHTTAVPELTRITTTQHPTSTTETPTSTSTTPYTTKQTQTTPHAQRTSTTSTEQQTTTAEQTTTTTHHITQPELTTAIKLHTTTVKPMTTTSAKTETTTTESPARTTTSELLTSTTRITQSTTETITAPITTTSFATKGQEFHFTANLDYRVTNPEMLKDPNSTYYLNLQTDVQNGLSNLYKPNVPGFRRVVVASMKNGSLIVYHIVMADNNREAGEALTKVIHDLMKGNIVLYVNNFAVHVIWFSVLDIGSNERYKFNQNDMSGCTLLQFIWPCDAGSECIESGGNFTCTTRTYRDNADLILGLGIGVPMTVLTIMFTAVMVFVCCRSKVGAYSERHLHETRQWEDMGPPGYRSAWLGEDQYSSAEAGRPTSRKVIPSPDEAVQGSGGLWRDICNSFIPHREIRIPRPRSDYHPSNVPHTSPDPQRTRMHSNSRRGDPGDRVYHPTVNTAQRWHLNA